MVYERVVAIVMRRWYLLLVVVVLAAGAGVAFVGCDAEPVRATLVSGTAFSGSIEQLQATSVRTSEECDELPVLIDHSGSSQLPDGFPVAALRAGDFVTVARYMGVSVLDQYGCRRATAGQLYMDLKYVEFRCGPATLITRVQDVAGSGLPGVLMADHWPDMGNANMFPGPVDPPYATTGILAWTNSEGNVGWGLGSGSFTSGPYKPGPHTVWSVSGSGPLGVIVGSDALVGIGMLPMSNHCILNPWFELRQRGEPVPFGGVRLAIMNNGVVLGYIYPEQGSPGAGFSGLELQDANGNTMWHVASEPVGE